jgi:hypothetical protein
VVELGRKTLPRSTGKPEESMKRKNLSDCHQRPVFQRDRSHNQSTEDHRHDRRSSRNKASLRDIEADSHQPGWRFCGYLEVTQKRTTTIEMILRLSVVSNDRRETLSKAPRGELDSMGFLALTVRSMILLLRESWAVYIGSGRAAQPLSER